MSGQNKKYVAVLFIVIMISIALLKYIAPPKLDEIDSNAKCIDDPSGQTLSTKLGDTTLTVPLTFVRSCISGEPFVGSVSDSPHPELVLAAKMPSFSPLSHEEQSKEIPLKGHIRIAVTGIPKSIQSPEYVSDSLQFRIERKLSRQSSRDGRPNVSETLGMRKYSLPNNESFYILQDEEGRDIATLACSQAAAKCSSNAMDIIPGLSISFEYPASDIENLTATRQRVKSFIESFIVKTE